MPTLDCVAGLALGETTFSTEDEGQDFTLSCRAGSGDDVAFELQVEETDYYRISTVGSAIDTSLAVLDDTCDGAELSCNDNFGAGLQSEIVQRFRAGDRAVVVASGNGEDGDITLVVEPVQCPPIDLTGEPLPTTKTTIGGASTHGGACGGDDQPERAYRYVPEVAGMYRFSVSSDVFDPAIYLERGPICGGEVLGCGYSFKERWPAEITRYLPAGEPVTAIVEGRDDSGIFELNIELVAGSCPADAFDMETETLTPESPHLLSTSCMPTGGANFDGYVPHKDHSYPLEHEIAFGGACFYDIRSSAPLVVSLIRGTDCSGAEVECVVSEDRGEGMDPRYEASISLGNADNGNYVLVVDSPQTMFDVTYSLAFSCIL